MRIRFRISYFLLLSSLIIFSGELKAAPQIIGLVATDEPTKLICADGVCKAEFSAFCLQQHRQSPTSLTQYRPSRITELTLSVTGMDGKIQRLPVAHKSTFVSLRNFAAVEISLPSHLVKSLGDGAPSLSVGSLASLIPVAQPGDDNPLSDREIALYTGPLRAGADNAITRQPADVETAGLLSRMINALPDNGDADQATRFGLWQKEIGERAWKVSDKAYNQATRAFRTCKGDLNRHGIDGMRGCLSLYHDGAMTGHTRNVWEELKPGG